MGTSKKKIKETYNQSAESLEQTGREVSQGLQQAGQQQVDNLNAADAARTGAMNEAQRLYQQRMEQGYNNFADIIAGEKARADQAEKEAIAQREAEQKAARWTGAGELVASIANMLAVGKGNAVNQQYHQYSQDWMRKAEENWRQNRARFDNIRDRQKALEQQLAHMKMNDAGQALNFSTRMADNAYQHGSNVANVRYNTSVAPLNVKQQATKDAAAARTQGVVAAENAGLHERQLNQSAKQHADSVNLQYDLHGFKKDPKTGERIAPASMTGSGKTGKELFHFTDDEGNSIPYYMSTDEMKGFLTRAYAKVKDKPGFAEEYGDKEDLRDQDKNSIIMKYAEQDPVLRQELYTYAPQQYQKSREISQEVNDFFGVKPE